MHKIREIVFLVAAALSLLATGGKAQTYFTAGDYTYTIANSNATIVAYEPYGAATANIPATLGGFPVTQIADYAFYFTYSVVTVTIPASVTSIGHASFGTSLNLSTITVATNNPNYSSNDGVLFDKNQTTLIQFPTARGGNYIMPNSVTSVSDLAFSDCSGINTIVFSSRLTSIGNAAFYWCNGLAALYFPGGEVPTVGFNAFENATGTVYRYAGNLAWQFISSLGGLGIADFNQTPYEAGQLAGRAEILATPNAAGLYTSNQLAALSLNAPLLAKNPADGQFNLRLGLKKASSLSSSYSAFPFATNGISVNAQGELEFRFTPPDNTAFFRLQAQ